MPPLSRGEGGIGTPLIKGGSAPPLSRGEGGIKGGRGDRHPPYQGGIKGGSRGEGGIEPKIHF